MPALGAQRLDDIIGVGWATQAGGRG